VKKDIAGAGYFYDLASHQLDLLDYLFGEITDVYGFTNNVAGLYEVEDSLTAAFCFKSVSRAAEAGVLWHLKTAVPT
jgi:predicted dehydrogenase